MGAGAWWLLRARGLGKGPGWLGTAPGLRSECRGEGAGLVLEGQNKDQQGQEEGEGGWWWGKIPVLGRSKQQASPADWVLLGLQGAGRRELADMCRLQEGQVGGVSGTSTEWPFPVNSFFLTESACSHMPALVEVSRASLLFIINSTNIDCMPLMGPALCWRPRHRGNKGGLQPALS